MNSAFVDALRDARKHTGLLLKQIAARTGLTREQTRRIFAGAVERPREYNANAITRLLLEELNAEIRRKREEIEAIRRIGEALKAAHAATYGKKERSA